MNNFISPASERELKLATSLHTKKFRSKEQLFFAEGDKVITELWEEFEPLLLFVTAEDIIPRGGEELARVVTEREMKRISLLDTPTSQLAIFRQKKQKELDSNATKVAVALDALQNPGNLGTIIRLCDWLGVGTLLCGKGTVDVYNPKVIQATAGALGGINIYENVDLEETLPAHFKKIVGTTMEGTPYNLFPKCEANEKIVLIFGNEGRGIDPKIQHLCSEMIAIPAAPSTKGESLNVAVSAAIILSRMIHP